MSGTMGRGGKRPGAGRPKGGSAKLSPRELRFVDFYLIELNGAKAAQMAGYAENSAKVTASRLLTRANVRDEIQRRMQALATKAGVSAEQVIEEFRRVAFSDIRKAVRWRSNVQTMATNEETGEPVMVVANEVVLTDSDKIDEATAAAISSISQGPKGDLKIKFHSKVAALTELGKHLGLFKADPDAGTGVTIEIRRLAKREDDADGDGE